MAEQRIDPTAPLEPGTPVGKARAGETPGAQPLATQPYSTGGETDDRSGRNPVVYMRQTVTEMRKVIWPTRQEMVNYTIVVVIFLVLVGALVFGTDWVGNWGVTKLFELTK